MGCNLTTIYYNDAAGFASATSILFGSNDSCATGAAAPPALLADGDFEDTTDPDWSYETGSGHIVTHAIIAATASNSAHSGMQ
jgi:hypothetical protein